MKKLLLSLIALVISVFSANAAWETTTSIAVGDVVVLAVDNGTVTKELSTVTTSGTTIGQVVDYSGTPAGVYPLTVVAGTADGSFAFQNEAGEYLAWQSGNSLKTSATLDDKASWTVTFTEAGAADIYNVGTPARKLQYNASSPRFACYGNSNQTAPILFKQSATGAVVKPTINPGSTTVFAPQEVTITAEEGATIYYTLNEGAETEYTAPFTVTETTTVEAYAQIGENKSETAKSIITFGPIYAGLAAANGAATSDRIVSRVNFTDALVTYVNGSNSYIQDATGALFIYGTSGLTAGDKVSGYVQGQLYLYNGLPEVANPTVEVEVLSSNNEVVPSKVDAADLAANPLNYVSQYVVVEPAKFGENQEVSTKVNVNFTVGETALVLRNNFTVEFGVEAEKEYAVAGLVTIYNTTTQLYPTKPEDVAEYVEAPVVVEPIYKLFWTEDGATVTSSDENFGENTDSPWGFYRYTVADGTYAKFTTFDNAGKNGTAAERGNAWYTNSEYCFVSNTGHYHSLPEASPAILFTAPADGIYKATMTVYRNTSSQTNALYLRSRYLKNGGLQCDKENYIFAKPYGTANIDGVNGKRPQTLTYYVKLGKGDAITFETESYTAGTNSSGRTIITDLSVTTGCTEEEAAAAKLLYLDPNAGEQAAPEGQLFWVSKDGVVTASLNNMENNNDTPWGYYRYDVENGTYEKFANFDTNGKNGSAAERGTAWYTNDEYCFVSNTGHFHSKVSASPAIVYNPTADGIYKVSATVYRMSPGYSNTLYLRSRVLKNGVMECNKENFIFAQAYGTADVDGADGTVPQTLDFFIKVKAGDRFTVETECYTADNDEKGRTIITDLSVTTGYTEEEAAAYARYFDATAVVESEAQIALKDEITKAEALLAAAEKEDGKTDFQTAIDAAKAAVGTSDEEMTAALAALKTAEEAFAEAQKEKIVETYTGIKLSFDRTGTGLSDVTVNVADQDGTALKSVTATLVGTSITEFRAAGSEALTRTENAVLAPATGAGYGNNQGDQITYTFRVDNLNADFAYNTAVVDVYAMNGGGTAQYNTGSTIREWTIGVETGEAEDALAPFVEQEGNDICTVPDADGGLYHKAWEIAAANAKDATAPLFVKVTLTKTAELGCFAGIGAVELKKAAEPEPYVPEFAYDKYLVKNVGSGLYWGAGNSWGTQASLIANPEFVKFDPTDMPEGQYKLESQVSNGGTQYYFNGDYMDNGSPVALVITKLPNGNYTIAKAEDGTFYGYDGTSSVLGKGLTDADSENAQWTIQSLDDAKAALANATVEKPMNANVLFDDLNFGRNNRYSNRWIVSEDCTNKNLSGGNNTNNCAESYHSVFTVNQNVVAPNGVYAVTAQGFYRQDGEDNDNLPVFFANDETQAFPLKTGSENSMSDASVSFSAGLYTIEPIYVQVSEGTLNIGTKNVANTTLWCIWDNFQVTYYGADADINAVRFAGLIAQVDQLRNKAEELMNGGNLSRASYAALIEALSATSNVQQTEEALNTAISTLNAAIEMAQAAIAIAPKLAAANRLIASTNVYTDEAKAAYEAIIAEAQAKYDDGTLTMSEAQAFDNPEAIHGWRAGNNFDDFLLSAWTINDVQCADFGTNLYINTWSTEGENDGSDFKVPFFEYWTGDANSLGEATLTATVTGLKAGGNYDVSAWVRVRMKNDVEAPATGITLDVNGGEAVDVTAGDQIGTSQFYLKEFSATGLADANGVLKINFNIAADNNISWLSFKNVNYAIGTAVSGLEADTTADNAVIYDLSGRRVSKAAKSGLYIINGNKVVIK